MKNTTLASSSFTSLLGPALPVLPMMLAACASEPSDAKLELQAIDERHAAEKSELAAAQSAFDHRWKAPFTLEFPGEGTIEVGECALQGYEEKVDLRLLYTYVNTTGRPIRGVRIEIELVDPRTHAVLEQDSTLSFPPMLPFVPESSYTTAVNIPTHGLHRLPGWEWRIRPHVLSKLGG